MVKITTTMPRHMQIPHSVVQWVMGTAVFAVLPHLTKMPIMLAICLIGITLWRISSRYRNPHWALRTLTVLIAVFIIFWLYQGLWGRLPGSQLLCCMLILKSFELNRVRDAMLMVSLSFFVVATWFLFSQSLLTFVYLIIASWLGLTTMIVINRNGCSRAEVRSMFVQGARLALPAVPLALAMFFLFPRLSNPLWGIQGGELEGVTGLSNSMSPGDISSLFIDDGPAFRVTFDGPTPPQHELYWRGPVLPKFNGKSWRQSVYSSVEARRKPTRAGVDYRYEVELEPHHQRWLFALDYPAVIPDDSRLSVNYQLRSYRPVTSVKRYTVHSDANFVNNRMPNQTLLQESLQVPNNTGSRAITLAQQWQTEAQATIAGSNTQRTAQQIIIEKALKYFRDNPFFYRLDSLPLLNDPIDEFLFDSRAGYCEHYASAFTFLMRAAGIPARVVTGYQGGIDNGDYFLVRQSDAHAWSEVWLSDELGWTRFDPTAWVAPERVQQGSRSAVDAPNWLHAPWLVDMRNQVDKLRHWWNQNIVSFNASRQSRLLQPWGIEKVDQRQLLLILIVLSVVISILIFLWYRYSGRVQHQDPVVRAYRNLLRRLRRAGLNPPLHAGPQTVMQTVISYCPDIQDQAERLFGGYIHYRYAGGFSRVFGSDKQRDRTQQLVEELHRFRLPKRK